MPPLQPHHGRRRHATYTYTGTYAGTDIAQAVAGSLASNTATAIWIAPVQTVSTTTIHDASSPTTTSAIRSCHLREHARLRADFPTINFDPVAAPVATTRRA